jgi:hypothetical protein
VIRSCWIEKRVAVPNRPLGLADNRFPSSLWTQHGLIICLPWALARRRQLAKAMTPA